MERVHKLQAGVEGLIRAADEFYYSMRWDVSDELYEDDYNRLFTLVRSMEDEELMRRLGHILESLSQLKWDEELKSDVES